MYFMVLPILRARTTLKSFDNAMELYDEISAGEHLTDPSNHRRRRA